MERSLRERRWGLQREFLRGHCRGEQCQDPSCRAGKDHDPEAVRAAVAWRDYDKQCLEFKDAAGVP
eukprot:9354234-Alexandrium_andersonii.AAC.1